MPDTRAELEHNQLERLNAPGGGLRLLRDRNRFYQPRLAELPATVTSLDVFSRIPFTLKSELVEDQRTHPPYGTNLTHAPDAYTRIHATSGTTGHRLKCLDTEQSWAWFTYCWQEIYRAFGIGRGDRVFAAFGFGPFVGFWAGFEAAQRVGALAIPAGAQSSAQRLEWLVESEATVLLSTPTYALRLIEVAAELGIDLGATSVQHTVHAGEPGGNVPSIRKRIESAWSARCWDHAGMSEVGPWGYQCPKDEGLHVIESEFIAEVVEISGDAPVADGELGELVLTNLGRWAQPALRYRTGDVVRRESGSCPCGSVFARFPGGVLGRVDDMIQIRGVNVYPSAVEAIIRDEPGVVEFQVEVRREREMWEMEVEVELDPEKSSSRASERIESALHHRLSVRSDVRVVPPGTLPRFELKARRFRIRR